MACPDSRIPHDIVVGGDRVDQLFSVLSHRYRRYIVQRLRTADRPLVLDQLALEIAARKRETSVERVSLQTADRVRTMLHHAHLPKLENASLVEYDDASGELLLTDRATKLDPFLDVVADRERDESD